MKYANCCLMLAALPLAWPVACHAGDFRETVRARQTEVAQLVATCKATEGSDGVLRPTAAANTDQRRVVTAENADRDRVWELVAEGSRVPKTQVIRLFAARSVKRNPARPCETVTVQPPVSQSACGLKIPGANDVARLMPYLKQGMVYAQSASFANAQREFEQVLRIDPGFPGVHKNIGSAQVRLKAYADAAKSFDAELKTSECLERQSDSDLEPYCYFVEPNGIARVADCRKRLTELKANTYYSQACLRSLSGDVEGGIESLRRARAAGFNDFQAVNADPDLRTLRKSPAFRSIGF